MNARRQSQRSQQQALLEYVEGIDEFTYFNLLTSPELLDQLESLLPEHRERLFPPTETLSMFVTQVLSADSSCQNAVNKAAMSRLNNGLPVCSTHTGAYCLARQRLPLELVKRMAQVTGKLLCSKTSEPWRWLGRVVKMVDGTTLSMPDTAENQQVFPQHPNQEEGVGFPLARLVVLTDMSAGGLLDAAIGPCEGKGSNEQSLFRALLGNVECDDVVLGDAFFPGYFLLCELQHRGADGVFAQHGSRRRSTDFRCGQKLGPRDHVVTLKKPKIRPNWMDQEEYDRAPQSLSVREFQVGGKVLVTTILSPKEASKSELGALYKDRWHVELDIRNIKTTLGMEVLRCKTPEMVAKELWVNLLAYNLIRLLMAQAAQISECSPRQLSFKHTIQLWLVWNPNRNLNYPELQLQLFILIAEQRVSNRPGRIEPRLVKRRPKPYAKLRCSRPVAREQIRTKGHP